MNGRHKCRSLRLDTVVGLAVLFHALTGEAIAGRGCGLSNFSDVPSSVVLSDVVLEGRLASHAAPSQDTVGLDSGVWRAEFTVDRVHKGKLSEEIAGKERTDAIGIVDTARHQTAEEEKRVTDSIRRSKVSVMLTEETHRCTAEMKVGHNFIVFLGALNSDFLRHGHQFYWASSPPTASTPKKIREVKKYSCKTCVRHPTVQLSSKKIFWQTGDDIKLKCIASGSPAPRITWFRNNEIVKASNRLEIISHRSSSLLIVRGADDSDGGVYSCSAENAVGVATSVDKPVGIESESLTMMQNDEGRRNSKMCVDQTYCENGGTCYVDEDIGKYCACPEGFTGHQCQDKGPEIEIGGLEDILVILCIFLMLLLLITTFAILYCIARFRKDFNEYGKRHLAIVEGERRIQRTCEQGERAGLDSLEKLLPEEKVKVTAEAKGAPSDIADSATAAQRHLYFDAAEDEDDQEEPVSSAAFHATKALPSCPTAEQQRSPRDSDEHFDNIISGISEHPVVLVGYRGKAPAESCFKKASSPADEGRGGGGGGGGGGETEVDGAHMRPVQRMTAKSPPFSSHRSVGAPIGQDYSSFASGGEVSSKSRSPPPPPACGPAVGGYTDRRSDRISSASSPVDKDATGGAETKPGSGQEMFYDEVNALLLELGVSEDPEEKKHCK